MKYKQPEEFFKYLKDEFGLSVFENSERCLAIASDMFEGDKQVNFLIKTAFDNKVYLELLKAKNSTSENKVIYIERAIKILTDDCGIDDIKALRVISWLAAIVYPNEWNSFNNEYLKILNKQCVNNDYIEQLQLENDKLKQENENLKKQLEARINNNQTEEPLLRSSERASSIQIINSIDNKNLTLKDIGLEMVYCPAGSFIMGSPQNEIGRLNYESQHKVIISKHFYIGKYPVTQRQYRAIIEENPSQHGGENNPIESVNYKEAIIFCEKLNARYSYLIPQYYKFDLPSEAQWEYACRAGTTTSLNSGKDITTDCYECIYLNEVGWYSNNSNDKTHPVGKKKPNAWGIYDMHGNVWEWCKDNYGDYPIVTVTNPIVSNNGVYHVARGGSWHDKALYCRSAYRNSINLDCRSEVLGFRIAVVLQN